MKHNMGKIERVARLLLGIVLFVLGWLVLFGLETVIVTASASLTAGILLVIAGVALFVTALFSYCPVYAILNFNTCKACRLGETHSHMPV